MGTIKRVEQNNLFMQSDNDCLMPLEALSIMRAVVLPRRWQVADPNMLSFTTT